MRSITAAANPRLLWVFTGSPAVDLDSATWLDTTAELRRLGWEVTLVVDGPAEVTSYRCVEVVGIPRPRVYLLGIALFHGRVMQLALRQWSQTDVIMLNEVSLPWLLPLRLLRTFTRARRPLFVVDTRTVVMSYTSWRDKLRAAYTALTRAAANIWADGQTAITQRMADVVGIPPAALWGVWPSGVDVARFAVAAEERTWPTRGGPIRLVYIGSLHSERHLAELCEAVSRAAAEGLPVELLLVGEGRDRPRLEQLAARSGGAVVVEPSVPHEQVPAILARAHVGVLPFPDLERFRVSSPIKLFEYMAAGMPSLATRITCHTDVEGASGFYFWAEDASVEGLLAAIRELVAEADTLPARGRVARAAADRWSWAATAQKLSRALEHGITAACGGRAR